MTVDTSAEQTRAAPTEQAQGGPRFRRLLGYPLLILGGLAGAFLLAEIGLRLIGLSYPSFYVTDDVLGYTLKPNAEGWITKEGQSVYIHIQVNSQGLRDREHALQKPPNTLRIAVIGDSFSEAMQVPIEETYWSIMERSLASCPALDGRQVEVINFGVAGYGSAQQLLMLRTRAWAYDPDIVLWAFFTGNDISDNYRDLGQSNQIPYFTLQGDQLVLDDSFRTSEPWLRRRAREGTFGMWLQSQSRVLQVLNQLRRLRTQRERGLFEEGLFAEVYKEPTDPRWQEAWRVTEAILRTAAQETRARGKQFLLVTLSTSIQANPDPAERQKAMEELGVKTLFYPDMRLKEFADRNGIPVLTLAPTFQQYAEQHHAVLHGTVLAGVGHWNAEGHRLAGELITQKMCSDILPLAT